MSEKAKDLVFFYTGQQIFSLSSTNDYSYVCGRSILLFYVQANSISTEVSINNKAKNTVKVSKI